MLIHLTLMAIFAGLESAESPSYSGLHNPSWRFPEGALVPTLLPINLHCLIRVPDFAPSGSSLPWPSGLSPNSVFVAINPLDIPAAGEFAGWDPGPPLLYKILIAMSDIPDEASNRDWKTVKSKLTLAQFRENTHAQKERGTEVRKRK
jgi:hypothetical protein